MTPTASFPPGRSSVDTARLYVERSNAHDLDAVAAVLAEDAVYESDRVGSFRGRVAILEMMRGFFARYPDVAWHVGEYEEEEPGRVRFDYRIRGTEAETGEVLAGGGTEIVETAGDGLIRRIRVR